MHDDNNLVLLLDCAVLGLCSAAGNSFADKL